MHSLLLHIIQNANNETRSSSRLRASPAARAAFGAKTADCGTDDVSQTDASVDNGRDAAVCSFSILGDQSSYSFGSRTVG